jgi:hypothetical protein
MDSKNSTQCLLEAQVTIQKYFIENRSRLLDIAAYLDRIDRSQNTESAKNDFRLIAFHKAIEQLLTPEPNRVDRIHHVLSDPTLEPLDSATAKSAFGAFSKASSSCC